MNDERYSQKIAAKYLLNRNVSCVNKMIICLCVDASESMIQDNRIGMVNQGIRNFIENCRKNSYSADCIDLCVITFGGNGAKIIQEFSSVRNMTFRDIKAHGNTPLASAVKLALDKIRKRVDQYAKSGITSYKPWLIIMSDGKCDILEKRELSAVSKEVSDSVKKREFNVKCIDMGNGRETLQMFVPKDTIGTIDSMGITSFFELLSQSVVTVSSSVPGEFDDIDITAL